MNWSMILNLIMSIISMILQFLSGGKTPAKVMSENEAAVIFLSSNQYACSQVYWAEKPAMAGSVYFTGTVVKECDLSFDSDSGIENFLRATRDQVYNTSYQVHSEEPVQTGFSYGQQYDHTVAYVSEDDKQTRNVRGKTTVESDGSNFVKNTFTATELPRSGPDSYLRGLTNEVEVTKNAEYGSYHVKFKSNMKVLRPWFVGGTTFQNAVTSGAEKKLEDRAQKFLGQVYTNF